ncbi:MAG: DNA polymerase III subunit delta [bacterium]
MIIFLYGHDTFRSLKKLHELKEKFLKNVDGGALNLAEIDGEKLTFADFKKEISTVSFMSPKRMAIFKNIISKNKDKNLQDNIIEYLNKHKNDETIIVFWEEAIKAKEVLVKYLLSLKNNRQAASLRKQDAYLQEFKLLNDAELRNWIIKTTSEKGGEIDGASLNMLIERIRNDLWQMNNELDKLISFSSKISVENIKKFVKTKDDENIFNLTDAIGNKNKKIALRLLTEQLRTGTNINYIITMLARQFRILLEVKDYLAKDARSFSPYDISRDLDIKFFVVKKILKQVKMYEMVNLKNLHSQILEIDLKSKTNSAHMELLLNMLIVKECR